MKNILSYSIILFMVTLVAMPVRAWGYTNPQTQNIAGETPTYTRYQSTIYEPGATEVASQASTTYSTTSAGAGAPRRAGEYDGWGSPDDPGNGDDGSPIGAPWVLLLMALAYAAYLLIKRNKSLTNMKQSVLKSTLFVLLCSMTTTSWATNSVLYIYYPNSTSMQIQFNYENGGWADATKSLQIGTLTKMCDEGWWKYETEHQIQSSLQIRPNSTGSYWLINVGQAYKGQTKYLDAERKLEVTASDYTCGDTPEVGDTPIPGCEDCFSIPEE